MSLIGSDRVRAVVGLGITGLSCAQFLAAKGQDFYVVDSREAPPGLDDVKSLLPEGRIFTGSLEKLLELPVTELFVSPGVALSEPVLTHLAQQGVTMRGDVDLFCEYVDAPLIAITGSNAKSTVTTMVADMLSALGKKVSVGGNLGRPALDLLREAPDYYVLEVSSFQLETTEALNAEVACVHNVSEDHMDRYDSFYDYQRVKQKVYRNCKSAVCNKQDILTAPLLPVGTPVNAFTTGLADLKEFGLIEDEGFWLCHGVKRLYHSSQIKLKGKHNYANILASFAILNLLNLELENEAIENYLGEFPGLPHRCEFVLEHQGVVYINDSKGTNVGATLAALEGLGSHHKNIHLLLGGQGKDADFSPLLTGLNKYVKEAHLYGEDAAKIASALSTYSNLSNYSTLDQALLAATEIAEPGDIVLFSPACASFDQFKSYVARGEYFTSLVKAL
jgi:UDP-N-acetylmuramoylalanine--D-glutamate ligase